MAFEYFNLKKGLEINSLYFKKNQKKIFSNRNGVIIKNLGILNIFNIRGNIKSKSFNLLIKELFSIKTSSNIGYFSTKNQNYLLNIGPDESLLICKEISSNLLNKLNKSLKNINCFLTDISDSYEVLNIKGKKARWVLSKGCPLNFDKNDFVPGKCAQSHISHLNFTIFCNEEDSFTLLCVSSFSNYLLDWLMDASTEHGYIYTNFNLQKEK